MQPGGACLTATLPISRIALALSCLGERDLHPGGVQGGLGSLALKGNSAVVCASLLKARYVLLKNKQTKNVFNQPGYWEGCWGTGTPFVHGNLPWLAAAAPRCPDQSAKLSRVSGSSSDSTSGLSHLPMGHFSGLKL